MKQLICDLYTIFENMAKTFNYDNNSVPYSRESIIRIKNDLIELSNGIKNIYPFYSDELFCLKDYLFSGLGYINSPTYGEIRGIIKALHYDLTQGNNLGFWAYIHPVVIRVSRQLYIDTHYSKAVQAAFVEINVRIKKIRLKIDGKELDGDTLMRQTFSVNNPLLSFEDNSTESGKNVQQGYMDIFAGVMKGIRNPNAHENIRIGKDDAVRKLMLASLLMYKTDEAVEFNNIIE